MFLEDNDRTGERGGALGLWRQGVIETVLNSSVRTQPIVGGGLMIVELRDKKKYWTRLWGHRR